MCVSEVTESGKIVKAVHAYFLPISVVLRTNRNSTGLQGEHVRT